jgi:hypothetical protein
METLYLEDITWPVSVSTKYSKYTFTGFNNDWAPFPSWQLNLHHDSDQEKLSTPSTKFSRLIRTYAAARSISVHPKAYKICLRHLTWRTGLEGVSNLPPVDKPSAKINAKRQQTSRFRTASNNRTCASFCSAITSRTAGMKNDQFMWIIIY